MNSFRPGIRISLMFAALISLCIPLASFAQAQNTTDPWGSSTITSPSSSTTTTPQTTSANAPCTINNFTANPQAIAQGATSALSWTTTGCNEVVITSHGGGQWNFLPLSGTETTFPLAASTTYTLIARDTTGVQTSRSFMVLVQAGTVSTDCPNSQVDCAYPTSTTPDTTTQNTSIQVFTTTAANIGTTSARINGLVSTSQGLFPTAYFQYGTNKNTLVDTPPQFISAGPAVNYYQTVSTDPSTTYYYRAVARVGDTLVRGSIQSFTSAGVVNDGGGLFSFIGSGASDKKSGTGASATDGVTLTVKNQGDKLMTGDTVGYTIDYKNGSGQTLSDASLVLNLPQGFTLKQGTHGQMVSPTTFQSTIGTIASGASGSLYVEAIVDTSVPRNETLVTNATLNFTLPGGKQDSAVGYVLNHVVQSSAIGGLAIGAGFFPTTIFGWFMTILIILILILVVRRIVRNSAAAGGHGPAHH